MTNKDIVLKALKKKAYDKRQVEKQKKEEQRTPASNSLCNWECIPTDSASAAGAAHGPSQAHASLRGAELSEAAVQLQHLLAPA